MPLDVFLVDHARFVLWSLLLLGLGVVVSVAWSWRFRRLTRTQIAPPALRWEAARGVVAAAAWVVMLLANALIAATSAEISAAEAIGVADEISPGFLEAVTAHRHALPRATVATVAFAVTVSLATGLWSGCLAALRDGGDGRD